MFALLNLVWKQQISSAWFRNCSPFLLLVQADGGYLYNILKGKEECSSVCLIRDGQLVLKLLIKGLSEGYDNIRVALLHIVQDPEQRADTQQEANGLHISLSYLDTVFMAVFWNIILERFNRVSMALQSAEIELGTAVKLLQSLQDFMSELRGNFDAIEMRAKQKDPSAKYKDAEKRIRKPKTQFGDESNGALTLRTQAYDVVRTSASDLLQNF